jgi:acetyl/propionyl-CoA carboxylase alpha subunit
MVTQWDLVREQLRIAAGGTLPDAAEPERRGHSIEFRVYAEDPYRGFLPSTGRVDALRLPHAPFTRIDHALRDSYVVPPFYDPMLGKVIAWGEDRPAAIRRLAALLRRIRIGGIHTTVPLGLEICAWPDFQAGRTYTHSLEHWLKERAATRRAEPPIHVQLASLVARAALKRDEQSPRLPATPPGAAGPELWQQAARLESTGRADGIRAP